MDNLPKGALRLNQLSEAIVRVGGIGTALLGEYVLHGAKQDVCRTFGQMVDIGAVSKHRIIGRPTSVWLTRKAWVRERYADEVAGDRFVNGSINRAFGPYPAFDHDRTADRFVYAMSAASGGRFLTQHEIDKGKHLWTERRPDAVLDVLMFDAPGRVKHVIAAAEIEETDKSGTKGGWMGLGRSIVKVRWRPGHRTSLGEITAVMVVANLSRAKSIAKKVEQAYMAMESFECPEPQDVFWFWSEIRKDGSFGPVLMWRLGQKGPDPECYWLPWNPAQMPRYW